MAKMSRVRRCQRCRSRRWRRGVIYAGSKVFAKSVLGNALGGEEIEDVEDGKGVGLSESEVVTGRRRGRGRDFWKLAYAIVLRSGGRGEANFEKSQTRPLIEKMSKMSKVAKMSRSTLGVFEIVPSAQWL